MKFLITESQLDSTIQTMIDQTLKEFSKYCDHPDADNWPDWLGFDDCNYFEIIERIKNGEIVKWDGNKITPSSQTSLVGISNEPPWNNQTDIDGLSDQ